MEIKPSGNTPALEQVREGGLSSSAQETGLAPESTYMRQLDGLRAVAVTLVLVYHWIKPDFFVNLGSLGVSLFFVLSGFLISSILLRCRSECFDAASGLTQVKVFYIRRFLRIFPIYYMTLAVAYVGGFDVVRQTLPWHASYLSNVLLAFYPGDLPQVAHFWSLAVEEQFYVIWPWLILAVPARRLAGVLVGVTAAAPLFRFLAYVVFPDSPLRGLPLGSFDLLGAGGLLAYARWKNERLDGNWSTPTRFGLVALIAFVAFLCMSFLMPRRTQGHAPLLNTCAAFFLTWIVANAVVGFRGVTGRFLENPFVVYLGKISYGIYIFHAFMGMTLAKISGVLPWFMHFRENRYLRFGFLFILTFAIAAMSWELFEKPINNLKRRFCYGRS